MRSHCPTNFALEHFGDRWTLLILRDLFFKRHTYFREFMSADEGISTSVLTDRLRMMEANGLISKRPDPDARSVQYLLTEKGQALGRVLLEINRWSGQYDPETQAPKEHLEMIENDFEGLLKSFDPPR